MPKGIPKKPGEEQTLEGGGAPGGYSSPSNAELKKLFGDVAVTKALNKKQAKDIETGQQSFLFGPEFNKERMKEEAAKKLGWASGGSASSRGDGIASRGKTRGRMI